MLVFPETQNHYIYCWNAPLGLVDNNGLFPTALAGAIGGGIIGGISYSVGAAISGDFSWKGLAASSAGGAATGALMCSGVTDPRVLGAAYAGTSAFVTGAIDTAQAAYKTYKSGGSASDVAKTVAVGLGNIAVSTVANAGIGALGGALFSGVGKAGAVGIGAISRGGATLIDELKDDKKGVNVGRVIRNSVAGAAEAYTAMTMFSGLKVGIDQGGTGTQIAKTSLKAMEGNIRSDVKALKYGAIRAIARLLPGMGSPAPVDVMCAGENGSGRTVFERQLAADNVAKNYNAKYKPSAKAVKKGYIGIKETPNGGVSFADSEYMYMKNGKPVIEVINATGNRSADFAQANRKCGFDRTPEGYTWHHLDNYNVSKNTMTMELVQKPVHNALRPHSGGCAQYDAANGPSYNGK